MADPFILRGRGGWLSVSVDETSDLETRVRFGRGADGRLVVLDVMIHNPAGVSTDDLRAVPLGKIQAAASSTTLPFAEQILAAIEADGEAVEAETRRFRGEAAAHSTRASWEGLRKAMGRARSLKLKVVDGKKPDAFYEAVAEVYSQEAACVKAPAQAIADANNVPVSTVHRWVKEARRRGFLEGGQRTSNAERTTTR